MTASPDIRASGTISPSTFVNIDISGHAGVGVYIAAGLSGAASVVAQYQIDSSSGGTGTYFITNKGAIKSSLTPSDLPFEGGIYVPGGTARVQIIAAPAGGGSSAYVVTATAAPTFVTIPLPSGANVTTFGGSTFGTPLSSPARLGGTPFTLRATGTAGGFAPPIVTATQPPQTVMTFSGKIPGATVNNYVIDAVIIRILGPAAVAAGLLGRVVKRHVLYASTQTAAPAAGAVPTGAALAYTGAANGGGTYQYKYVAVDIWGNEGNYSAASANVAPAANNGVTVTMPAVPAGAAGYNVYRTVTGPGATWFFLGRTNTTTFRDITPDSALTLAAGTIGAWGTLPAIETVNAPMELVMEKFVALTGTAPVIISTKTFPGTTDNNRVVTIAPGAAVGRYRIPGEVEAKAFLAAPTITTALARDIDANYTYGGKTQINAAFGDIAVNSFNQSDAGMGGTFVVWGHELVGVTEGPAAAATAGFGEASAFSMKWVASPVFAGTDEIAIEIGSSITNNAVSFEITVSGRYF